jgi:peptide deformylase
MILPIVKYGHPVLRQKGAAITRFDEQLRLFARDMLETMYSAQGVGLAAQQVGKAVQVAVIDVRDSDRPSQMFLGAKEVDVASMMPLVLVNPRIVKGEGSEIGVEGCLSFPKLTADIERKASVQVSFQDLAEQTVQFTATGLLGRAVQHELDHLNGVLFIDRMTPVDTERLADPIEKLRLETISNSAKPASNARSRVRR